MTAIQTAPILFIKARIRTKCAKIDSALGVMRIWPMVDRKFGSVNGGSARQGDIWTLSIDDQNAKHKFADLPINLTYFPIPRHANRDRRLRLHISTSNATALKKVNPIGKSANSSYPFAIEFDRSLAEAFWSVSLKAIYVRRCPHPPQNYARKISPRKIPPDRLGADL